jgi:hypothetical protein
MPNPNPKTENLTHAGMGRPRRPEKVRISTTISRTTKEALQAMGGAMGDNIDEVVRLREEIKKLQQEIKKLHQQHIFSTIENKD